MCSPSNVGLGQCGHTGPVLLPTRRQGCERHAKAYSNADMAECCSTAHFRLFSEVLDWLSSSLATAMSGLAIVAVVSVFLAFVVRSFWRQLLEVGILVVLFVLFIGVLTLVTEGRLIFNSV